MRFQNTFGAASIGVCLLLALPGPAVAHPATQCDIHQRHLLRVGISVAAGQMAIDKRAVTGVIDQVWAPEGIDIEWIDEIYSAHHDRLDAWVVVGRKGSEFSNSAPRSDARAPRMVWISADEVAAHLEQALSLQLQVPRDSVRHLMFGNGRLIERSLGYAIAHQLGHSVMGLPHAVAGLMSEDYNRLPGFAAVPSAHLDAGSRRLLQQRFALGCAER